MVSVCRVLQSGDSNENILCGQKDFVEGMSKVFVIYGVGSLLVKRCDTEHNLLFQITLTRVDSSPTCCSPGEYLFFWGGGRES